MLNIIHRLKPGMLPALFFLTPASVLAQPHVIPPGHWQEGMVVGATEFSGTLYVRDISWQWQPRSARINTPDIVKDGLINGQDGTVSESRVGENFYILGGHTSSLTTPRPGLLPSVTLLQVTPSSPCIVARGELSRGQVRYGEITFTMRHLLAWQDSATADKGWSVVNGNVTPDTAQQVNRQLGKIPGYHWIPEFSGLQARPDAFISPGTGDNSDIAGAWVTSLQDIQVRFPGSEEPVKRWQANLTPVVKYF
ncbi:fimbrial protein [Salmonella enterica subsp. enterica serovar Bredeney]|nr:fimbrial protein [Salmonella enterica subsp. enterica serovar Bredeney]